MLIYKNTGTQCRIRQGTRYQTSEELLAQYSNLFGELPEQQSQ
ncbi:hypothetical protein [Scytonema hofmannii]|nr:hypothetical protein [Scytonema hofmannii]